MSFNKFLSGLTGLFDENQANTSLFMIIKYLIAGRNLYFWQPLNNATKNRK